MHLAFDPRASREKVIVRPLLTFPLWGGDLHQSLTTVGMLFFPDEERIIQGGGNASRDVKDWSDKSG